MEISDLRSRFFSKISAGPENCVDWCGAAREAGYGLISVDNVLRSATHVSWFLRHGVWPSADILHTCDRPPCVNPEHLFEGTAQDNAADRDAKGRGARKLTGLEISELVALTHTRMGVEEISVLFGVTPSWVSHLRHERGFADKPMKATVVMIGGASLTFKEAAARFGVPEHTIRTRARRGITGEDLIAPAHAAPRKPYQRRV